MGKSDMTVGVGYFEQDEKFPTSISLQTLQIRSNPMSIDSSAGRGDGLRRCKTCGELQREATTHHDTSFGDSRCQFCSNKLNQSSTSAPPTNLNVSAISASHVEADTKIYSVDSESKVDNNPTGYNHGNNHIININSRSNNNDQDSNSSPNPLHEISFGRKWKYFPGKNKFYCNGRIMTSPSIRYCVLSFLLILVTYLLFVIFDGPFLASEITIAIPIVATVLFICVTVNMIKTSLSDPGILPRATKQEWEHLEKYYSSPNGTRPPPRTKDIVVNGQTVKSKFCYTCKLFRPPRVSHCGVCDNCVDRFDHHCPFLGNCIGKRNYRYFYSFVVSLSFLAVFVLSCSIAHLALVGKRQGNFLDALKESPTSAVVIIISFFGMWAVIGLAGFHTYLIAVEQTTNEDIKGTYGRTNSKNPYSRGNPCSNCCFILCGPIRPSFLDSRSYVTRDFLESLPSSNLQNDISTPKKPCSSSQTSIRPNIHCPETVSNNDSSNRTPSTSVYNGATNSEIFSKDHIPLRSGGESQELVGNSPEHWTGAGDGTFSSPSASASAQEITTVAAVNGIQHSGGKENYIRSNSAGVSSKPVSRANLKPVKELKERRNNHISGNSGVSGGGNNRLSNSANSDCVLDLDRTTMINSPLDLDPVT